MTDKERFSEICSHVVNSEHRRDSIGTYGEKSVHLALKMFFEEDEECREVPVGKFIADIKNDHGIIEIQSSGFGALKHKLEEYLYSHGIESINIVFPVIEKKHVIKISPETGEVVKEYASPRHVKPSEIFKELLYIGENLHSPKISFTLVSLYVDEISYDTEGKRRRKTSVKIDKIPRELLGIRRYDSVFDMGELFSFDDGDTVTAAQIRSALRASGRKGWAVIRIMEETGFLERCGKDGNKILYKFIKFPKK